MYTTCCRSIILYEVIKFSKQVITIFFRIEGKEYMIGSKIFPTSSKDVRTFTSENTKPLHHEELNRILDINEFEIAHCYTNAQKVLLISERLDLKVEYYAGWIFVPYTEIPVHHAWTVINGIHLIDIGMSERLLQFQKKVFGDPNWRKRFAEETVAVQKLKPSKRGVIGHVPEGLTYIGSVDEIEAARKRFRDMMARFPRHPSYSTSSLPSGATALQQEIWNMQGKKH